MKIHSWTVQAAALLAILSLLLFACSNSSSDQTASSGEVRIVTMTQTASNITADQHVTLQKDAPVIINNSVSNYDIPVIDFVTDNTGFAVKEKYGESLTLIATKDGGTSWTEKKLPGQFVRSLDFIDSSNGWLLIEEGCSLKNGMTTCSKLRLLTTHNGGSAWTTQWQAGSKEDRIHSFTNLRRLSFQDSKNGVMLANGYLYVTSDGGSHFKAAAFGLKDFTPLSMSFPKGQTGYVTGTVGKDAGKLAVLRTSNGGRTWQKQLEITAKESPLSSIGIQFINEKTSWLLTNDTGMMSGEIYRTTDGGKHWNKMSTQRTGRPTPTDIQLANADIGMISLHPGAGPIEGGIWLTKDGGKSFTSVAPNHVTAVNQLQMLSTDHIWAAANDMNKSGYLLHSSDGGRTWKQTYPKAYPLAQPTEDMSLVDAQSGYAIGTQLDSNQVLQTEDGASSWKILTSLKGYIHLEKISFISKTEGYIAAYTENEPHRVLLKTSDGGKTWSELERKSLSDLSGVSDISFFRFFDRNHGIIFASGEEKNIWRTSDGGLTWNKTTLGVGGGSVMKAFFISPSNGWILKDGDKKSNATLAHMTDGEHAQTVLMLRKDWYPEAISFADDKHGYMMFEDFKQTEGFRFIY